MRPKLTYANVVATLALFIAIGGASAFAASQLGKNTVGTKQLKKNSIITAKIKNEAVTAAKVKKGTLTGTQINSSTLGTVPTAQTAQTASALAPPEAWHEVGAPGEPAFQHGWKNDPRPEIQSVAFYRDQLGFVHLRGGAIEGGEEEGIFQLPPGYRPPKGKSLTVAAPGNFIGTDQVRVFGTWPLDSVSGEVRPFEKGSASLDGITFRAEG